MAQQIRAIMIIEMAGRPPEHVKEALKNHTEQLKNLKDLELININISEPKKLESEQEMYTCFAEVEIKTETLSAEPALDGFRASNGGGNAGNDIRAGRNINSIC